MNPSTLLQKYYSSNSVTFDILMKHSELVTKKAVTIAQSHPELHADVSFIEEAAMLHDIGIFLTNAPELGCFGACQYIAHGYLGAAILRKEGLPRHALVCERHTGTGIALQEIIARKLPLPHRDMLPQSIEEQIICFADKFFSKSCNDKELSIKQIQAALARYGEAGLARFNGWAALFSLP